MAQNEFAFNWNNQNKVYFATAAPTSGTYTKGDFALNSAPAAAGVIGWICVTSGSPGTWQPAGAVAGPYTFDTAAITTANITSANITTKTTTGVETHTPATTQTLTASTAITATRYLLPVLAASAITLTVAPSIANGTDGQEIVILNVGSNAISLQDQGTLASSNLRLDDTIVTLAARNSLRLVYNATVGDWVQVGKQAVL